MPLVLIASVRDDLHALAVQRLLLDRGEVDCRVLETDALYAGGVLTWRLADGACVPTDAGPTPVSEVDVVWWRRSGLRQSGVPEAADEAQRGVIDNDCAATALGALLTSFTGTWVSHPTASRLAENKLVQLAAAHRVGWRVPATLVSQDPAAVAEFRRRHGGVVVKAVAGTRHAHLPARLIDPADELDSRSVTAAPAIYQEFVPGERHHRVFAFGDTVLTTRIEATDVDWRWDLDVPFVPDRLDPEVDRRLLATLDELGLRMGVFDLKEAPDGEPVWLEVNPQGQFLFAEGLSGVAMAERFADHLAGLAIR